MNESNLNTGMNLIFCIFAIFLLIIFLIWLSINISEFLRELKYLNNEISRTTGSEQRHWIKKKRKLFLSLIPFVKYR